MGATVDPFKEATRPAAEEAEKGANPCIGLTGKKLKKCKAKSAGGGKQKKEKGEKKKERKKQRNNSTRHLTLKLWKECPKRTKKLTRKRKNKELLKWPMLNSIRIDLMA